MCKCVNTIIYFLNDLSPLSPLPPLAPESEPERSNIYTKNGEDPYKSLFTNELGSQKNTLNNECDGQNTKKTHASLAN